jgi:hypothetical protein
MNPKQFEAELIAGEIYTVRTIRQKVTDFLKLICETVAFAAGLSLFMWTLWEIALNVSQLVIK